MIWLTWRQFRTQAGVVFAAITVLAVILAVTGPNLAHDYATGIASCTAHGGCSAFTDQFFNNHQTLYFGLVAVVMFVPAIIGLFWGAPLITRELEAGTHRLVWNQSITRTRWLAVKLGLIGLAAMATAGLGSLAVTWWSSPIDKAAFNRFPRLSPLLFDARGIAPIGYAAFAFALGVTVGMLIRRTLPAMAAALAAFAVVQMAMPLWIRPHLIAPTRLTTTITATNLDGFLIQSNGSPVHVTVAVNNPGAWIISNQTINAAGHVVKGIPVSLSTGACVPAPPPQPPFSQACFTKISQLGYRQQVAYQPASRFWAFQWYETAIFLALALALAGFCFWWIRRRLS
jgi:hypothetical protein